MTLEIASLQRLILAQLPRKGCKLAPKRVLLGFGDKGMYPLGPGGTLSEAEKRLGESMCLSFGDPVLTFVLIT